jgi:hypothetical protein
MAMTEVQRDMSAVADEDALPDYLLPPNKEDMVPEDHPDAGDAVAAAAAPPVDTKLEVPATGLYGTHNEARRFGIAQTIEALLETGRIFAGRHPGHPVGIGDISKRGGGRISGHASHRKGVDVDIRLLRTDGKKEATTFTSPEYSRAHTQELIDVIRANSLLAVQFVFFNDPKAEGVQFEDNHHHHLHVRFHMPGTGGSAPPLLVVGSSNKPAVREMQRRLNSWIKTDGPAGLEPVEVDGKFDTETEAAVKAFQTANGLGVDGKVGKNTWGKLPKV